MGSPPSEPGARTAASNACPGGGTSRLCPSQHWGYMCRRNPWLLLWVLTSRLRSYSSCSSALMAVDKLGLIFIILSHSKRLLACIAEYSPHGGPLSVNGTFVTLGGCCDLLFPRLDTWIWRQSPRTLPTSKYICYFFFELLSFILWTKLRCNSCAGGATCNSMVQCLPNIGPVPGDQKKKYWGLERQLSS